MYTVVYSIVCTLWLYVHCGIQHCMYTVVYSNVCTLWYTALYVYCGIQHCMYTVVYSIICTLWYCVVCIYSCTSSTKVYSTVCIVGYEDVQW